MANIKNVGRFGLIVVALAGVACGGGDGAGQQAGSGSPGVQGQGELSAGSAGAAGAGAAGAAAGQGGSALAGQGGAGQGGAGQGGAGQAGVGQGGAAGGLSGGLAGGAAHEGSGACKPGASFCDGDTLMACDPESGSFKVAQVCGVGACKADKGACDGCLPGQALGCKDAFLREVCDASGKSKLEACPMEAPYCTGEGACVACKANSDCKAWLECYEPRCVEGVCSQAPSAAGVVAGGGGCVERQCDGSGGVVEVVLETGAPCKQGVCDGKGSCGACVPGMTACASLGSLKSCGADGSWSDGETACAGDQPACSQGACVGVRAMALGERFACALLGDGGVRCWGGNDQGQLGLGLGQAGVKASSPQPVPGLSAIVQLAAGVGQACALDTQGKVRCWGDNSEGQVGIGEISQMEASPRLVALDEKVASVAVGGRHTCALTESGGVYCWGLNDKGQAAVAGGEPVVKPTLVAGLGESVQVVAGLDFSCALGASGSVRCWGSGADGQLGSSSVLSSFKPVVVEDVSVAALAAGSGHLIGGSAKRPIGVGGNLMLWGDNTFHQIFDVDFSPITPFGWDQDPNSKAAWVPGYGVTAVVDPEHSKLEISGINLSGQLGNGKKGALVDHSSLSLPMVAGFASGPDFACAWQDGGKAWCWGRNQEGQLGLGATNPEQLTPAVVSW